LDVSRDAGQPRNWQDAGRRAMRDIVQGRQRRQRCGWPRPEGQGAAPGAIPRRTPRR